MAEEQPKELESAPRPREIIRLLQCPICYKLITEPVILPCGYQCCRLCQSPQLCPFCRQIHTSSSQIDKTLWMVKTCFEQEMDRLRAASSRVSMCAEVGVQDTIIHKSYWHGKLLAMWDLAKDGSLRLDNDIIYIERSPTPDD
ncbi:uncharacterized protein TRIVIDRAFT_226920 [Trichoderma virens Gv29-8]|uniref:RING-type domain-containing protein n=1 Tax=Hypocrea virens (strain Gv29-8 / FGSC 10586) TaxID=413071 RepID=G9N7W6_HYPVG|nr:uncharacterized protein TRIVIDRAFT_226920 [Trichoderma virens Gv29-8]EHK17078.1 hypothetical protein TRIVIDRAFT_226920 [Trichoderma virens Gv29-8]UKZ55492.1 hypothetical protein TrVGV298_009316 [Trichoderma virens]